MGKRIDYSFISGTSGMPFKKGTWKHLQDAIFENDIALVGAMYGADISALSGGFVLYGCNNNGNTTTYDIRDGAIAYNGKLYQVTGSTFTVTGVQTAVANIVTTYYTDATADPTTFTDGAIHNVHVIEKITFQAGAVGSGIFNYYDLQYLYASEQPIFVGDTGAPAFTSPSNVGNDPTGVYEVLGFHRSTRNHTLTITGTIKVISYPGSGTFTVFTLPAGYRPAQKVPFIVYIFGDLFTNGVVNEDGTVVISGASPGYSNVYVHITATYFI
jgi:hypothetical protein